MFTTHSAAVQSVSFEGHDFRGIKARSHTCLLWGRKPQNLLRSLTREHTGIPTRSTRWPWNCISLEGFAILARSNTHAVYEKALFITLSKVFKPREKEWCGEGMGNIQNRPFSKVWVTLWQSEKPQYCHPNGGDRRSCLAKSNSLDFVTRRWRKKTNISSFFCAMLSKTFAFSDVEKLRSAATRTSGLALHRVGRWTFGKGLLPSVCWLP